MTPSAIVRHGSFGWQKDTSLVLFMLGMQGTHENNGMSSWLHGALSFLSVSGKVLLHAGCSTGRWRETVKKPALYL